MDSTFLIESSDVVVDHDKDGMSSPGSTAMLSIHSTYQGFPAGPINHLVLPKETLLIYPSVDSVVILNAQTLALVCSLAIWEAFPGARHSRDLVSCISVDPGMKLIFASTGSRLAAWALSGVRRDTWRVHSSLALPSGHTITTLDSKSGLLAVGTESGLSVYTLILDNDLPTWTQKWVACSKIVPTLVRFSPSLMYIATITKLDTAVRLYSTTTGRRTQTIPHARPITDITWRHSQPSSRDDLILYTITSDSILRIFLPVLDSPQHLQLHASLDLYSALPYSVAQLAHTSNVFWLDRDVIHKCLDTILSNNHDEDDASRRRIQEIKKEGWDIFLHALDDGSVVLTAVANIDRRPPTLLRQFTLQHSQPLAFPQHPSFLYLIPSKSSETLTIVTSSPLRSYSVSPLAFFEDPGQGLHISSQALERVPQEEADIVKFVRTPEGKGVGVLRTDGSGEVWNIGGNIRLLHRAGSWTFADQIVVLDGGKAFGTYCHKTSTFTLCTASSSETLVIPPISSLFTLPSPFSDTESIFGVTDECAILHIQFSEAGLSLRSQNCLPLSLPPKMILPVDPMAWVSGNNNSATHDTLLSLSETGELAFWVAEEDNGWQCTGKVRTGKTGISKARCSSAKKTALIVPGEEGEELTIWDSKESEFASGLEFRRIFSDPINDLDWTSTPNMQSILAVGFLRHIELLCQQRMTYFDEGPAWAICWKIDLSNIISHPISDSIWLANGSLLVGAGHQMLLYGQNAWQSQESAEEDSLFLFVGRQNGPLDDYHPQMLLQCLLWEKVELVKEIIVRLAKHIEHRADKRDKPDWEIMDVEKYYWRDQVQQAHPRQGHKRAYTMLFNGPQPIEDTDDDEGFSRPLVDKVIERLENEPLPHLTPNEHAHLLVLIQTTLDIDEQRRSLDASGLRYLISMRSFYILNHRASKPGSPASSNGGIKRPTGRRERLRYRDMIWAFHSESQELLLNASTAACNGKMCWSDARALGIPIWLTSMESLKSQLEVIARNEYMAGDNRDPTACSLLYFALGKTKLVHGLWRQAAWHKEQTLMLKFLANDFTQDRWKTAALKNAYALLSKQRFEYAAAFFLLGGSLQDAVTVCLKQLQDFQLAVALARIGEQSNDGPVLSGILTNSVLPIALKDGNRWLASWAFWLLHRRDLAVRVILTPLQDIAATFSIQVSQIGEPHYDDPSLALLFLQLRSKTLQTAKGTSEISGRSEFNFILQMARVFCRMGCHALGVDLVRSWSFERPSTVIHRQASTTIDHGHDAPLSPTASRRSLFSLQPAMRRHSSMVIDMDIISLPPTRPRSPERNSQPAPIQEEPILEEGDLFARKAGIGNLMKSAKQDVKVAEFDMSAFGF